MLGIGFGIVLSLVVSDRRAGVWKESAAIAVVAVVAVGYFSTDSAGGSGYLGAFLAGLIVGNMDRLRLGMHSEHERDMRSLVGTITEVVVILVFITLGANLPWSDIWDNLVPALVVVVVGLILLARPLTVLLCLGADRRGRWTREEMVFLAWTRETGVVAAALAGLMVARDIPHAELIVATVAVAIVVTLAVQTTTKVWLGRRLGLDEADGERTLRCDSRRDRGGLQGVSRDWNLALVSLSLPVKTRDTGELDTGWRSPVAKRSKRNG